MTPAVSGVHLPRSPGEAAQPSGNGLQVVLTDATRDDFSRIGTELTDESADRAESIAAQAAVEEHHALVLDGSEHHRNGGTRSHGNIERSRLVRDLLHVALHRIEEDPFPAKDDLRAVLGRCHRHVRSGPACHVVLILHPVQVIGEFTRAHQAGARPLDVLGLEGRARIARGQPAQEAELTLQRKPDPVCKSDVIAKPRFHGKVQGFLRAETTRDN
jgi:hypothetical protein